MYMTFMETARYITSFLECKSFIMFPLQWRHNGHDGVSNHQLHDCLLLSRLFRRRSKKTLKLPSLAFVRGIHRWPVKSPHKWPVTRTMFPLDDVIIESSEYASNKSHPLPNPCDQSQLSQPVYGVDTICHQVRCIRWGHPSLFHTAASPLS